MRFWNILWGEMRRYWRPFTLIVVAALLLMWNVLFGSSSFAERKGTDPAIAYDLSVEYSERFGETIDPNERAEVEADYEKALAALNDQYEKYMGQYDIHSEDDCHLLYSAADAARNKDYESEDYCKGAERWGADNLEELAETCNQIFWDKIPYEIAHRKQMLESILRWAEHVDEWEQFVASLPTIDRSSLEERTKQWEIANEYSPSSEKRLTQVMQSNGGRLSLLECAYDAGESFQGHFQFWAALIFILCGLIVLPLPVGNRVSGVTAMQYSTRTGRRVIFAQSGGAILNTLLVNAAVDGWFTAIFFLRAKNTLHLWNCPMNLCSYPRILWLDLTFGKFVWLTFGKVLLLSLALTGILFVLSHLSKNYLPALALAVPSVILFIKLSYEMDYMLNIDLYAWFIYPLTLLVSAVVAMAAVMIFVNRTRKADYAD